MYNGWATREKSAASRWSRQKLMLSHTRDGLLSEHKQQRSNKAAILPPCAILISPSFLLFLPFFFFFFFSFLFPLFLTSVFLKRVHQHQKKASLGFCWFVLVDSFGSTLLALHVGLLAPQLFWRSLAFKAVQAETGSAMLLETHNEHAP